MKKNFYKIGVFFLIAALLVGGLVFADVPPVNNPYAPRLYNEFVDLSVDETGQIEQRIAQFSEKYGVDLVFMFTSDYVNDYLGGDSSYTLYDFADMFREARDYGAGVDNAVIMISFDDAGMVYNYDYFGAPDEEVREKVNKALDVIVDNIFMEYWYYNEEFNGIMNTIELIDAFFGNIAESGSKGHRVFDFAGLLTDAEKAGLEARAAEFGETNKLDVVFLFADRVDFSVNRFNDGSSGTFRQFVEDFYDYLGFGYKKSNDGIVLALSMAGGPGERDYCLLTTGSAEDRLPDSTLDYIEEKVVSFLGDGNYNKAAHAFLDSSESVLDGSYAKAQSRGKFLMGLAISAVAALVITLITAMSQKTVVRKSMATEYIVQGSVNIKESSDHYINTTVTRTKIKSESSGGGSTGSSGTSHGGRSGKF